MADQPSQLQRFWLDLKRRRIFQTGALYVVVAWALIQAGSIAFPAFGLPDWAIRALLVAAFAGFPVVLVLAWVFDVSSAGIEVTSADEATTGSGSTAAARTRRWLRPLIAMPILALIVGGTAWLWTSRLATSGDPEFTQALRPDELPIVAVLPLENLSGRRELDWAGRGLATLVRDSLAQSRYMAVVSAARTLRLAPDGASLDELMQAAADAGITHVLTGEILRTPKGLTVTSRLTDLRRDVEAAANRQEGLTAEELLTIATPVASLVKQGLGLPGTEKVDVFAADFATRHLPAYEAFIAGMENFLRFNYADARRGFEVAVQKAPDFAMARYRLAHTLAMEGDFDAALAEVRRARSDSAALPAREKGYIAAGEAYFARDYELAEQRYRALLRDYPYESEARVLLMYMLIESGRQDEALVEAQTLAQQDPGDEVAWSAAAHIHLQLAQFEDADAALGKLRELAPDNPNTAHLQGDSLLLQERFAEAEGHYAEALRLDPAFGDAELRLAQLEVLQGRRADAIERLRRASDAEQLAIAFRTSAVIDLAALLRADGRCAEAEQALVAAQPMLEQERVSVSYALWLRGMCRLEAGQPAEAQALAVSAIAAVKGRSTRYVLLRGLCELQLGQPGAVAATIAALEAADSGASNAAPSDQTGLKSATYLRGMQQLAEGNAADAVTTLQAAIALPGTQFDLYALALARAQAAAGDRSAATQSARSAAAERDLRAPRFDLEYSRAAAAAFASGAGR